GFSEVDLHTVRSSSEGASDVRLRLVDEIRQEGLSGVAVDPLLGVEEAQRRGGDDGLLHRPGCVPPGFGEVRVGVRPIAEWAFRQERQLPRVAVGERNHDSLRREAWESLYRIGRKARLALLAVRYHGRPGGLE